MSRPPAEGWGLKVRPIDPAKARLGLLVLYFLSGFTFSTWLSRLPSVRATLGLSAPSMGALLVAGSIGGFIMLLAAGSLVNRIGGRICLNTGAGLLVAAFGAICTGLVLRSIPLVAVGIFLNGTYNALTNVPQNMESAGIERLFKRSILPHFHASFAIGSLAGSLAGAQLSAHKVPAQLHLAILVAVIAAIRFTAIRFVVVESNDAALAARRRRLEQAAAAGAGQPTGDDWPPSGPTALPGSPGETVVLPPWATGPASGGQTDRSPTAAGGRNRADGAKRRSARAKRNPKRDLRSSAFGAWLEGRTLLIGVMAFAFSLSEGTASNWMPMAVVDGFEQTEAFGAMVLSIFQVGIALMRWIGTRAVDRFGRVRCLRASGALCIAGLVLFAFAPVVWLAAAGAAAWGIGAALNFPIALAAAADQPVKSAGRVAVVSAFATAAQLVAPPVIGLAGATIGLRHAFLGIAAFLVVAMILSPAIRHQPLRRRRR